jgi:RimJ/RimL family protein N-acetyltransferase
VPPAASPRRVDEAGAPILEWRDARRDDRQHLRAFVCTSPDRARWVPKRKQKVHPRPWELDAQSAVRKLKPPTDARARIRVAFDDVGLAAVVHVALAESNDHGIMVPVIALAQRLRGGKHHVGGELATEALRCAANLREVHNLEGVGVFARIHPNNRASRHAFEAAGFDNLGLFHVDETMPGPIDHHTCANCVEGWASAV